MKSKLRGSVALTTVILVSGLLLLGGLTVIVVSIDVSRVSKIVVDAELAKIQTTTCFEEGLLEIKQNPLFEGLMELEECSYTIIDNANPDIRYLVVQSQSGPYTYSNSYRVDTSISPFSVSEDDMLQ